MLKLYNNDWDFFNLNDLDENINYYNNKEFYSNVIFRELEFNYFNPRCNIRSAYNLDIYNNNHFYEKKKKMFFFKANTLPNKLKLEKDFFYYYGNGLNNKINSNNFINYKKRSKIKLKKINDLNDNFKENYKEIYYASYSYNKLSISAFFKKSLTLKGIFCINNKFFNKNSDSIFNIYPLIKFITNNDYLTFIFSYFNKNICNKVGPVSAGNVLLDKINEFKLKEFINKSNYNYSNNTKLKWNLNEEIDSYRMDNLILSKNKILKDNICNDNAINVFNSWYRELCWYRTNNRILRKYNLFDFFDLDLNRSMFLEKRYFNIIPNSVNYKTTANLNLFYINWLIYFFYSSYGTTTNYLWTDIISNSFYFYTIVYRYKSNTELKYLMKLFRNFLLNYSNSDDKYINFYLSKKIDKNLLMLTELDTNEVFLKKKEYILSVLNEYYTLKKLFLKFLKDKNHLHVDDFYKKLNMIFNFLKYKDYSYKEYCNNIVFERNVLLKDVKKFSLEDLIYLKKLILNKEFFNIDNFDLKKNLISEKIDSNVDWYFEMVDDNKLNYINEYYNDVLKYSDKIFNIKFN